MRPAVLHRCSLATLAAAASAALALCCAAPASADEPSAPAARRRSLSECVNVALQGSGQVQEAEGKVAEWRGRLDEVKAIFYPKITAIAFAAPIFGIKGLVTDTDVQRQYDRWGPYLKFDGLLMQPVYTFGQQSAGENAARERMLVEEARLQATRNAVALEVARYYYLHLYVASIRPSLESTRKILDDAMTSAQEMYDEAQGKVTMADLQKLKYVSTELDKYRVQADIGAGLSMAALKHTMGRPEAEPLELADAVLPPAPKEELLPLSVLVQKAWDRRPEAAQIKHGRAAALSLEEAERLANYPIVAVVGQLSASWTAVRTDQNNTFAYDPYNDLTGGVALAFKWDLDPMKASARGDTARALVEQIDGLAKFAQTGIPTDVRRCRDDYDQARRMLAISETGSTAARKWMLFSAAAYASGTGETKDVLEGLGAFVQAKKSFYDALLSVHMSRATLAVATGEVVDVLGGPVAARPVSAEKAR
ncbi:MAG TPA: TolC family protein [Myxococcales bacterium]|jgi:outer membrane protein TolC